MIRNSYRTYRENNQGLAVRRYWKILYTAALRFGVAIPVGKYVDVKFVGNYHDNNYSQSHLHHHDNEILFGKIILEGKAFDNTVVVQRTTYERPALITFWPESQLPEAKNSTTDPLVDIAMGSKPISTVYVVENMHSEFLKNPGISPSVLLNNARLKAELEQDQILFIAESYKMERDNQLLINEELSIAAEEYKRQLFAADERNKKLKAELDLAAKNILISGPANKNIQTAKLLSDVKMRVLEGKKTIILKFDDNSERKNNWSSDFSDRLKLCSSFIGKFVQTDSWGGFDPNLWFQNIWLSNYQPDSNVYKVQIREQYQNMTMSPYLPKDRWQQLISVSNHVIWNDTHKKGGRVYEVGEIVKVINLNGSGGKKWYTTF